MITALDTRLQAVANEVPGPRHADIGTDHALLPRYLVERGRCQKVIGVEKSPHGVQTARWATQDFGPTIEIRLGEGLQPLKPGEVDSLSLSGLGGLKIVEILEAHPERLPPMVIIQANRDSSKIRAWGWRSGFHLVKEQAIQGHWLYQVLTFRHGLSPDPAYQNLPLNLGLHFGPHLLKAREPALLANLKDRWTVFAKLPETSEKTRLREVLEYLGIPLQEPL